MVVRCLKLASFLIALGLAAFVPLTQAQAEDAAESPKIKTYGEAKKIVIKNRVEVVELRGARRNPNFLEESFHAAQVNDVNRWNHQHDHITPVKGLKHQTGNRMPAGEIVKQPASKRAKTAKAESVALNK